MGLTSPKSPRPTSDAYAFVCPLRPTLNFIVCGLPHPPPTTFARYEKSGGVTPTYNVHVKPIDDAIPKKEREKLVMQVRV